MSRAHCTHGQVTLRSDALRRGPQVAAALALLVLLCAVAPQVTAQTSETAASPTAEGWQVFNTGPITVTNIEPSVFQLNFSGDITTGGTGTTLVANYVVNDVILPPTFRTFVPGASCCRHRESLSFPAVVQLAAGTNTIALRVVQTGDTDPLLNQSLTAIRYNTIAGVPAADTWQSSNTGPITVINSEPALVQLNFSGDISTGGTGTTLVANYLVNDAIVAPTFRTFVPGASSNRHRESLSFPAVVELPAGTNTIALRVVQTGDTDPLSNQNLTAIRYNTIGGVPAADFWQSFSAGPITVTNADPALFQLNFSGDLSTGGTGTTLTATYLVDGTIIAPTFRTFVPGASSNRHRESLSFQAIVALPAGTHTIALQVSQTGDTDPLLNQSLTVIRYNSVHSAEATQVSAAAASGAYGGNTMLSATLTAGAVPIAGKSLAFSLLGSPSVAATTDLNGVATLTEHNLAGINAGSYPDGVGVTFAGDASYAASSGTASLTVAKATPIVTWPAPADIVHGTALNDTQLNATASVLGTFTYTPAAGTVLDVGADQMLSVTFTPSDTVNYNTVTTSVMIDVLPVVEVLTVTMAGAGSGTVTSNPPGINCPGTCGHGFTSGTQVGLTATATAGSTFTGWSGACSGAGACTIAMDAAKSVTASFAPNQADLLETAIGALPPDATPSSAFVVTDTTLNQGATVAAASTTRFYLSSDPVRTVGDLLLSGTRLVPMLSPAASSAGSATVKVPAAIALGRYYVLTCADDRMKVPEASDANNCLASPTTLLVGRPDLAATSAATPSAQVAAGGKFTVTDTVTNQGNVTGAASKTQYYLSGDPVKDSADILLTGTRAVTSLAPGASSTGSKRVTVPLTAAAGTYHVLSCADDLFKVVESNEANNCVGPASTIVVGP